MPHPMCYVSPSGPILLPPKGVFPLLPPPPPPPAGLYKNTSPPVPGCWAPLGIVMATRQEHKARKIICIRDPSTGQDITQEILHSSQLPAPSWHLPTQTPFGDMTQLMFPNWKGSLPNISWYEPPQPLHGRSSSPPCLCCSSPQPISWQQLVGLPHNNNNNGAEVIKYSRDFLLSIRYQPLSVVPPPGLPDLSHITNSKSSGDLPSRPQSACTCPAGMFRKGSGQRSPGPRRTRSISLGHPCYPPLTTNND